MQRRLVRLSKRRMAYTIPILCCSFLLGNALSNKCFAASSATLTLGQNNLSTTVTQGDIAYLSSTIKVDATDIESYTLSISGPVGLSSNGGSTITGANNKTPANMANNSWGYAYNDSNANNTKTYKSFTGSAQTLETGTTPSGTAKNITFAAKFASNATSTHYTAQVTVNLVATPKKIVFDGITKMQEMTSTICNNATVGDTTTLTDSRDSKPYSIRKMEDGRCWMTQNLNLRLSTSKALTSTDSDVSSWTPTQNTIIGSGNLTSSDFSDSSTSDYYRAQSYATAANATTTYYSFTAATASTGSSSLTTKGVNASSSICPKNWRLPTGLVTGSNTTNDFYNLFNSMDKSIFSGGTLNSTDSTGWAEPQADNLAKVIGNPYNFGYTGFVNKGWLDTAPITGFWWSSTVASTSGSYNLYILSNYVFPGTHISFRSYGYAVRCIAR